MNKTKQRLLQIKTSLEHQDYEMAELQLTLINAEPAALAILMAIQEESYDEAMSLIDSYLSEASTDLVEYQDSEIESLKGQLKELEELIESLAEQKSEQLFLINEFTTQQSFATGEIVQQILKLRRDIEQEKLRQKEQAIQAAKAAYEQAQSQLEALKTQREALEDRLEELDEFDKEFSNVEEALESLNEDILEQQNRVRESRKTAQEHEEVFEEASEESYQQAQQEYEEYEEAYQEAKEDKVAQLDEEDIGLLKKLYRKAAKLCHPDIAADDVKDQATEMMQQLNHARDQGDIEAIKSILAKLENGTAFIVASDRLTDRTQIENKMAELIAKLEELGDEIESINKNETWLIIISLDSWNDYFEEQKNDLTAYLTQLEQEYKQLLNPEPINKAAKEFNANPPEQSETQKVRNEDLDSPVFVKRQNESQPSSNFNESYWDDEF